MQSNVDLAWDLDRERPTLGGALVLRQEGELLAEMRGQVRVRVFVSGSPARERWVARLATTVFSSSARRFELVHQPPPIQAWPSPSERERADFSYFSFSRLIELHRAGACVPRLCWNAKLMARVGEIRHRFAGKLVAVHLRRVPPYTVEESNADGAAWGTFFAASAHAGIVNFLLVGSDALPAGVMLGRGVSRATDLGLDLATQLALIGRADAFLGMASGVCTAANLSAVPHVIFKHPAHHTAEMERMLGGSDRFSFADSRQRMWRREGDSAALREALDLLLS